MTRSILVAATAAFVMLAGCGTRDEAAADGMSHNSVAVVDNVQVEDVASDGLAAPADMPMDSESNSIGNASGGNAM